MNRIPEFDWQLTLSLLCVAVAIGVLARRTARTFRGAGGCSGCAGSCDSESDTDAVTVVSEEQITIHCHNKLS